MEPTDRVLTNDYPARTGTITEVQEEFLGTLSCYVVLDDQIGEGWYLESNLQPLDDDLASEARLGQVMTSAFDEALDPAEAAVDEQEHLASDDYPMLAEILQQRLPPIIAQHRKASFRPTNDYGLRYSSSTAAGLITDPLFQAARAFEGWDGLPTVMVDPKALWATEGSIDDDVVQRLAADPSQIRPNYTAQVVRIGSRDVIVDGNTRAALYATLGRDMPVKRLTAAHTSERLSVDHSVSHGRAVEGALIVEALRTALRRLAYFPTADELEWVPFGTGGSVRSFLPIPAEAGVPSGSVELDVTQSYADQWKFSVLVGGYALASGVAASIDDAKDAAWGWVNNLLTHDDDLVLASVTSADDMQRWRNRLGVATPSGYNGPDPASSGSVAPGDGRDWYVAYPNGSVASGPYPDANQAKDVSLDQPGTIVIQGPISDQTSNPLNGPDPLEGPNITEYLGLGLDDDVHVAHAGTETPVEVSSGRAKEHTAGANRIYGPLDWVTDKVFKGPMISTGDPDWAGKPFPVVPGSDECAYWSGGTCFYPNPDPRTAGEWTPQDRGDCTHNDNQPECYASEPPPVKHPGWSPKVGRIPDGPIPPWANKGLAPPFAKWK